MRIAERLRVDLDVGSALKGLAAVVVACGSYVAATLPGKRKARSSLPAPAPRGQLPSSPESMEVRMSRMEEWKALTSPRIASCESDIRGIQNEQNDMREHLHDVEKGAIERQALTNEKLATIAGALSVRGGRR